VAAFGFLVLTACGGGSTDEGLSGSVATTSAVSDDQLAAAAAVGDIAAGEELFYQPVAGVPDSVSCSSCHSLDAQNNQWAPTLAGISAVAANRVDGMSDVDYLRQSIADPYAFRVGGEWAYAMPYQYPDALSEDQIDNLIAFLLTR
jgi:mono/diheme cytochrome c family protein